MNLLRGTVTSSYGNVLRELALLAVNPLVADALALYVKTKNFHWHVAGPHFRDYHLLLDEQPDSILEFIDVMAERVRRVGGATIRTIGHVSKLQNGYRGPAG